MTTITKPARKRKSEQSTTGFRHISDIRPQVFALLSEKQRLERCIGPGSPWNANTSRQLDDLLVALDAVTSQNPTRNGEAA